MRWLGAVGVAVLAFLTAHDLSVWQSEEALWQQAVRVSPTQPQAWVNLGRQAIVSRGDRAAATRDFARAMELAVSRPAAEAIADRYWARLNLERLTGKEMTAWIDAP